MRAVIGLILAAVMAQMPGTAPARTNPPAAQLAVELTQKFSAHLESIATEVDGVMGYVAVDLTSGDRVAHLDRTPFPTASTIKLAVVYELYKQVDEGKVRLDEVIPLDRRQVVGGSGVLFELGTPTLSLGDYATLMVVLSDNTATNVVIDRLGLEQINRTLQSFGLTGTRLGRHMMDLAAARRGDENVSTPGDLARLLQIVYSGEGLKPSSREAAVSLLKKSKVSRLRRGLPAGVDAADKPGELEGVRVDAGIVFAPKRPYVLVVMTTYLKSETDGEQAIEEASREAYSYYSRLGEGTEYGRQIERR